MLNAGMVDNLDQNNFVNLMDIHVQRLAWLCWICGDKIKDHMHKVDTN